MRRLLLLLLAAALLSPLTAFAQDAAQAVAERQRTLQRQLDEVESQSAAQQKPSMSQKASTPRFSGDVDVLDAQIRKTQLQIQQINLTISKLSGDIGNRNKIRSPRFPRSFQTRKILSRRYSAKPRCWTIIPSLTSCCLLRACRVSSPTSMPLHRSKARSRILSARFGTQAPSPRPKKKCSRSV